MGREERRRRREEEEEEEAERSPANMDYGGGEGVGVRRRSTFRSVSESPK